MDKNNLDRIIQIKNNANSQLRLKYNH